MGTCTIDINEELHDRLRHKSIDEKKDIKDLIVEGIELRVNQN